MGSPPGDCSDFLPFCHQKPVRIFVKMSRVVDGKAPGQSAAARKGNGNIPSYAPNQTLYVTNIPSSKIQKSDLRISLYMLFSTYGPVLDVVALKTMKMRGQRGERERREREERERRERGEREER